MKDYPTPREKTQRAFRTYTDLLDTAEWMRAEMHGPLELFDLTMSEFRLLELLYREGALPVADVGRRRRMKPQNTHALIGRLGKRGWVRRVIVAVPPVEFDASASAKFPRGRAAGGTAHQRGGPDEAGKEVHGRCPAEAFEGGEGVHARAHSARAEYVEPALPETARGRHREIYFRDHARGCGGFWSLVICCRNS